MMDNAALLYALVQNALDGIITIDDIGTIETINPAGCILFGYQQEEVIGENISQAAQFATSGSTEGGIIAYSLALAPQVAKLGDFALIPQNWHQPLAQRMVLLKNAPPAATEFYHFIASPQAQTIMVKYGFVMPAQ